MDTGAYNSEITDNKGTTVLKHTEEECTHCKQDYQHYLGVTNLSSKNSFNAWVPPG